MALAVVGIMVMTGFAVLGQAVLNNAPAPAVEEQPEPAKALAGAREATYTIDHMFELYLKSHNPADLGRWNDTLGLNEWWPYRDSLYQEYQARTEFPFVLVYNPYSTKTSPDIDQGGSITTWYRLTVDARNITEISAGPGSDPIFTPVLGPISTPGAYMNISWYGTYLETWEMQAIRDGLHYANSFYGVPARSTPLASADDGYWHELQGILTFNRAAAGKILGLTAAGDLMAQFTAAEASIESAWFSDWMAEGGGVYDTYTAYDYSNDIRWLELYLDVTNSTADNLVIRFWSVSWGNECLLQRYLEAANVQRYWQGWPDDWYLNISIGPDGGNIQSRAVIGYHMYATKDTMNNINGWALEASHIDWCGNAQGHTTYITPYSIYDPDQTAVTHISSAPLTTHFGQAVSYIVAPLHWNLTAGEKVIVKLPSSTSLPGYRPQTSASDILGATKIAEMAGNVTLGQMVVGNGYPNSGTSNLKNFYNKATKTYTLTGPLNFAPNWNTAFPGLLNTGAPMFVMNVVQTHTMNLVTGWNFVSLPLVGYGYKASTLGLNTGDTVTQWNPATKVYQNHIVGVPVNDFNILPSVGYWVNVPSGTRTLSLYGVEPNTVQSRAITLPAGGGWAIIGFASLKTTMKAANIPAMYAGGAVTTVAKWNPVTKSYTSWLSVIPAVNNFALVPGDAYWILAGASGTLSYTP
jgi:hypothetical protein